MNKKISAFFPAALLLATGCNVQQEKQDTPKTENPNILMIVVDDLGYSDLHCYGGGIQETPNVDKLAAEGIRFTNAYASCPVSSPTRASLLTGKNPVAVDITDWIPGHQEGKIKPWHKFIVPEFNWHLPLKEITIAEKLKEKGYKTASIGKWHLGGEGYLPTEQGFDINIAGNHKGMPPTYYYPYKADSAAIAQHPWLDFEITHLELTDDSLYLTDRLANEAINFIKNQKDTAFFLYLPFYTVHTPLEGREDLVKKYTKKIENSTDSIIRYPHFLAMVECMDENVGRIINTLEELEIRDNTIIFFVSDNGGLQTRGSKEKNEHNHFWASWNYPLRQGKGTLYEGGLRVPTIINWPGKIDPGRISDELIISTDLFPTIMDILDIETTYPIEGVSLLSHLTKGEKIKRETFYWHYPHYHRTNPGSVIRDGDYKLIHYYEDDRVELYNLKEDISEKNDLTKEIPEKANELLKKLNKWLDNENAKMPQPNPNYEEKKTK